MDITASNPESGEEFKSESNKIDNEFIDSMSDFKVSDDAIKKLIDSLNVSADTKNLLYKFSKITINAGKFILKIGRKIIDFICKLFNEFPSTSFGIIFGAIVGFLISSIPIVGVVLGPIFLPLSIAFGLVKGLQEDVKDKNLARRIAEANAQFSPLNA